MATGNLQHLRMNTAGELIPETKQEGDLVTFMHTPPWRRHGSRLPATAKARPKAKARLGQVGTTRPGEATSTSHARTYDHGRSTNDREEEAPETPAPTEAEASRGTSNATAPIANTPDAARPRSRSTYRMTDAASNFCPDPLGLEDLPLLNIPQHQLLWLLLLEMLDEGQIERLNQLATSDDLPGIENPQIAARLTERIRSHLPV